MQPIHIRPLTKPVIIRVSGRKVALPAELRTKIDAFWQTQQAQNPNLFNGEAFTVTDVEDTDEATEVTLAETDYAHYLYGEKNGGSGQHGVRVIHSAALVVTADNKAIFGSMGPQTSRSGILQCSGGGIDYHDIANGVVDLDGNTARELLEELGVDVDDTARVASFRPAYFKSGGPAGKMTVAYVAQLHETADEFLAAYAHFVQQLARRQELPEFGEIISLPLDYQTVEDFTRAHSDSLDEYMTALLLTFAGS